MTVKFTQSLKIQVKQHFIEGYVDERNVRQYPSVDYLAKTHDIPRATLFRHSSKEDWQGQKNRFQTKIETKVSERKINDFVKSSARLDESSLNIAQALLNSVAIKLQKSLKEVQSDERSKGLSNTELKDISQTALNAQKIGKLALGEAQEISKVSANVATTDDFRGILDQIQQINRDRSEKANHTYQ